MHCAYSPTDTPSRHGGCSQAGPTRPRDAGPWPDASGDGIWRPSLQVQWRISLAHRTKKKRPGQRPRYVPPQAPGPVTRWGKIAVCLQWRPTIPVEWLAAIVSVYFAAVGNVAFWRACAAAATFDGPNGGAVAVSIFVALAALQFMLLCCMLHRLTTQVVLTLLLVATSVVSPLASESPVYVNAETMRATLHAGTGRIAEFLTTNSLMYVFLQGILPSILVWRVRLTRYSWEHALSTRILSFLVAMALAATALHVNQHEISVLMRQHPSLKHLVAPANLVYAAVTWLLEDQNVASELGRQEIVPGAAPIWVKARPETDSVRANELECAEPTDFVGAISDERGFTNTIVKRAET